MKKDLEEFCPAQKKDWRTWLKIHHRTKDAVWLVMYKKGSASHNLTWSEAVDEALCFGWIDSVKRPIDDEKFMQYFGKRKANSTWSKINKEKIEILTKAGLMTEAGQECVNVARQNGSWTFLDSVENLEIPEDLEQQFRKYPKAKAYYLGLTKSKKKGVLYWIKSAKRPETRQKRINDVMESTRNNKLPKHFGG